MHYADLSRPEEIRRLADVLLHTASRIDVRVNNANVTASPPRGRAVPAKKLCTGPFPYPPVPSLIGRFWSSAFRPIHHCGVDITRGLVLLFGIGTTALPVWVSKTRWNNLLIGLALERGQSKGPDELTSSIVPRGTSSPPLGGTRMFSYRL